jgi:NAD(P)H-dependent FMN reductase
MDVDWGFMTAGRRRTIPATGSGGTQHSNLRHGSHTPEQYIHNGVIRITHHSMHFTIISGTNRADSNTLKVARRIDETMRSKGLEPNLMTLEGLDLNRKCDRLRRLEEEILIPTEKFAIVIPEYNGSYPGSMKTVIDLSDIRNVWWGKKAMLTGVSTGRAGNLRGMEHLTGTLNYLKVTVMPNRLPISVVDKLMDAEGRLADAATLAALEAQIDEFIAF